MTITATVGLPIRDGRDIAWLAMESLCRQNAPSFGDRWELIVAEDATKGTPYIGQVGIEAYEPRLQDAGCARIVYSAVTQRLPLSVKWQMMANMATPSSICFLLQGADDYSDPNRVSRAIQRHRHGSDWCSFDVCPFYQIPTGKMRMLNARAGDAFVKCGPFISIDIQKLRRIVPAWIFSGNDMHLFTSVCPQYPRWESGGEMLGAFCTDGANLISDRSRWYERNPPSFITDPGLGLRDIPIPDDIIDRLESLKRESHGDDDARDAEEGATETASAHG